MRRFDAALLVGPLRPAVGNRWFFAQALGRSKRHLPFAHNCYD